MTNQSGNKNRPQSPQQQQPDRAGGRSQQEQRPESSRDKGRASEAEQSRRGAQERATPSEKNRTRE